MAVDGDEEITLNFIIGVDKLSLLLYQPMHSDFSQVLLTFQDTTTDMSQN